eukprot:scaffold20668_cov36-Prasinocladus_malaysianus.AAC.1
MARNVNGAIARYEYEYMPCGSARRFVVAASCHPPEGRMSAGYVGAMGYAVPSDILGCYATYMRIRRSDYIDLDTSSKGTASCYGSSRCTQRWPGPGDKGTVELAESRGRMKPYGVTAGLSNLNMARKCALVPVQSSGHFLCTFNVHSRGRNADDGVLIGTGLSIAPPYSPRVRAIARSNID